jgi:hypothetical protein
MSLKTALTRINCFPYKYCRAEIGEFAAKLVKRYSDQDNLILTVANVIQQVYEEGVADGKREAGEILTSLILKGSK